MVGTLSIELDREDDGRWIAEITQVPGALAYGTSREYAIANALEIVCSVLRAESSGKDTKGK